MNMAGIIERFRLRGWTVTERESGPLRLPVEITDRHPEIPTAWLVFLHAIADCTNDTETEWLLCESEYLGTSGTAFRWNEWELMSFDAAEGHPRFLREVRAFWDAHLPFLMSVRDGYAYFAIRTAPDGFGRIVYGRELEFEQSRIVAESLEEFINSLLGGSGG